MNTQIPACMGGWCKSRQHCAMYYHSSPAEPDERMCPKDQDKPIPVHWPALSEALEGMEVMP